MPIGIFVQNVNDDGKYYVFGYNSDTHLQVYHNLRERKIKFDYYLINPHNNFNPKTKREAIGIMKKQWPKSHLLTGELRNRMTYNGDIYFLRWL